MSTSSIKVLVHGAGSAQGRAVVSALLAAGHRVRALVRRPEAAPVIAGVSLETAIGDLSDATSLQAASQGVDAVYVHVPASVPTAVMADYAGAALLAAREAGVRRAALTVSSVVPDAPVGIPGPDMRRAMVDRALSVLPSTTVLSVTLYLENFSLALRQAIEFGGAIPQAVPADVPVSYLSMADQARYAVAALESGAAAGRLVRLGGADALTGEQLAKLFTSVIGRPVEYQYIPPEGMVGFLTPIVGPQIAAQISEMYAWEGSTGRDLLVPDVDAARRLLGVSPSSTGAWIREHFVPVAS